ncbi:hypothetical protein B0H14DRAFT_3502252 [Mycena olivaceomarginata]|nr:hypothetical protein B0H14DRAFT_3502252 [Mycena olivaceomarginata]
MTSSAKPPTFPMSKSFNGHFRGEGYVIGVRAGDPELLLNFPTPKEAPSPKINSWMQIFTQSRGPRRKLRQLRTGRNGLPVTRDGNKWTLAEHLRDSWAKLESGMRRVLQLMQEIRGHDQSHRILPFLPEFYSAWPHRHGYYRRYKTHEEAQKTVLRSRNAFLPLMASITMIDWRDRVLEKLDSEQGHAQWFADLENSAVGNRTIPRVGGILDLTNVSDANVDPINRQHKLETLIEVILRENLPVPLYFFWGKTKDVPDYPIPRRLKETGFYPDWQEIRYLRDLPGETAFSPWHEEAGRMYSEREHRPPAPPTPPVASSRDMTSILPVVVTPVLPVVFSVRRDTS